MTSATRHTWFTILAALTVAACDGGGTGGAGGMGGQAGAAGAGGQGGAAGEGGAAGQGGAGGQGGAAPTTGDLLYAYLQGDYDSEAQSLSDPAYFAIGLRICPVDAPELGSRALYVEQAALSSPNAPYRQRFYVVEDIDGAALSARSRVFEVVGAASWVGACDEPLPTATAADANELIGCNVDLAWETDHFVGGTIDDLCANDFQGATYATSEVELWADRLVSWDRGYDAQGNQVWGATKGAYVFDRKSMLAEP
jgi:CpeT protein